MEQSIKRKQEQRELQMIKLEQFLLNETNSSEIYIESIVSQKPIELLSMLKNDQLSAVQVLNAFQFKALQVTKKLNCITEFIPEAQKWAEDCDKIAIEDRKILHGLPVSIKECFNVQGMDSTIGLSKYLFNPASKHCILVQILIDNGAIPFCKTNVGQTLLSFCCSNPIYGNTLNPHDETRTPGGSSGGECALIAAGGSVVGIGTDLGGSCRMPATSCGCCGFKFTSTRVTANGFRELRIATPGIASCTGVLGRDAEIISIVARAIISMQDLNTKDASVIPLPWNCNLFNSDKRLTIGYFEDAKFFPCTPGVKRAVREAKKILEDLGHRVVPFSMIDSVVISQETNKIFSADQGKILSLELKLEIYDPSIFEFFCPSIFDKLFTTISPILSAMNEDDCHDVVKLWHTLLKRRSIVQNINDQMNEHKIDLLLSPAHALPAPQHFVPSKLTGNCFYTVFANYCDFVSGTVPITKESEEDQNLLNDYPEDDSVLKIAKNATRGAIGMPIGVLLSGRSFQEELVLRTMEELQRAICV